MVWYEYKERTWGYLTVLEDKPVLTSILLELFF